MNRAAVEAALLAHRTIDPNTGCWLWTGGQTRAGRGVLRVAPRRVVYCYRLAAWLWLEFDITSPLFVCHRCDDKRCFNPAHLFIGTHADNMRDAQQKGRMLGPAGHPRGEQHCCAKLTDEQVQVIRQRVAAGERQTALAAEFGLDKCTVNDIVHRRSWRHLP